MSCRLRGRELRHRHPEQAGDLERSPSSGTPASSERPRRASRPRGRARRRSSSSPRDAPSRARATALEELRGRRRRARRPRRPCSASPRRRAVALDRQQRQPSLGDGGAQLLERDAVVGELAEQAQARLARSALEARRAGPPPRSRSCRPSAPLLTHRGRRRRVHLESTEVDERRRRAPDLRAAARAAAGGAGAAAHLRGALQADDRPLPRRGRAVRDRLPRRARRRPADRLRGRRHRGHSSASTTAASTSSSPASGRSACSTASRPRSTRRARSRPWRLPSAPSRCRQAGRREARARPSPSWSSRSAASRPRPPSSRRSTPTRIAARVELPAETKQALLELRAERERMAHPRGRARDAGRRGHPLARDRRASEDRTAR